MLYKIGENLEAKPEDIAQSVMIGELVILSQEAATVQQFLTAYRTAYSISNKGVVYLAFSESELDPMFSVYTNIKQYKNFLVLDVGEIKRVLTLVTELEEPASDSDWLSDAASKADGSGE